MTDRNETKVNLRDWMTAITQLFKVHTPTCTPSDITYYWRSQFDVKMNEQWVKKALYGKQLKEVA